MVVGFYAVRAVVRIEGGEAQAQGALAALEKRDLVVIHVESPDEEGHEGDVEGKVAAIEAIDRAEPNRHSPWCTGVHDGGACEGEAMMLPFVERLRAIAERGGSP